MKFFHPPRQLCPQVLANVPESLCRARYGAAQEGPSCPRLRNQRDWLASKLMEGSAILRNDLKVFGTPACIVQLVKTPALLTTVVVMHTLDFTFSAGFFDLRCTASLDERQLQTHLPRIHVLHADKGQRLNLGLQLFPWDQQAAALKRRLVHHVTFTADHTRAETTSHAAPAHGRSQYIS